MADVVQMAPRISVFDSFTNFMSNLGVFGRDKSVHTHWSLNLLTPQQLEYAFRSDWIARKIVTLPAFDSTRAWRSWEATSKQTELIEETERKFGYQLKLMIAMERSRLYGGAAIIIGTDQGKFNEELEVDKIGKDGLKFMHVVSRWHLAAGQRVRDIMSPWYGEPSYFLRSNVVTAPPPGGVDLSSSESKYSPGEALYIHPSRVVCLTGHEYPDMESAPDAWGDSVLQPVADALKDAGLVSSSIAAMVAEAKVDVIKVPGLLNKLSTEIGASQLSQRFANANAAKSVINALLIDKDEDWDRKELRMTGIDKLLQMYMLICAGAADIPATRLLGREPAGQNATGEGDTRNYYDRLSSEQKVKLTPALSRLDEVMLRSTFGKRDPGMTYSWNPLWQLSGTEQATVILQKSQAFKIDAESGMLSAEALARGRVAQLVADEVYPGMSAEGDEALDLELLAKERDDAMNPPEPLMPPGGGAPPNGGGEQPKKQKPRPKPKSGDK